jgi:glycosyltransferase involved in cell wall biosynthesis
MKIACIIPTYNTPIEWLEDCIASVFRSLIFANKTHDFDFLLLIMDDGSNELHRPKHACTYRLGDTNKGTSFALNRGHELAKEWGADYVMLSGASDISHEHRLKKQLDYLKLHPDTDVLGTGLQAFRGNDHLKSIFKFIHPEKPMSGYLKNHHKFFITNHGTTIYKLDSVLKVGGYNEAVGRGQDVDLWSRMYPAGMKIRNIQDVLYYWRRN